MNAGWRNVGRFFLFAIPLVLGLGASAWFGLWITGHNFNRQVEAEKHELSQQERSAVFVGAGTKPKGKLAIEIVKKDCLTVIRADIDTVKKGYPYEDTDYWYSLVLYAQSNCQQILDYAKYQWELISPNGVVLKSGYENTATCPVPHPAEIAECSIKIQPDERTEKIRVWVQTIN